LFAGTIALCTPSPQRGALEEAAPMMEPTSVVVPVRAPGMSTYAIEGDDCPSDR
jgi:hypothetical protein